MENGSGFLDQLSKYGPNGIIIVLLIVFYFQLSGDIGQLRTEMGQLRTQMNQMQADLVSRIDRLNERIDRHIELGNHSMAINGPK